MVRIKAELTRKYFGGIKITEAFLFPRELHSGRQPASPGRGWAAFLFQGFVKVNFLKNIFACSPPLDRINIISILKSGLLVMLPFSSP